MLYRYPLQKIVDLKNNEKKQAEWMLAAAVGQLQTEEQGLQGILAEKQRVQETMKQSSSASVSIQSLQLLQEYVDHLARKAEEQTAQVNKAQQRLEHSQDQLKGCMLDEKKWSMSKEKAYQHYIRDLGRKEQNELDEIAVVRFAGSHG
ncbi:flagellar export protein FliJ [Xylanibacillus composti]|nr:flagellar export protein FliJ [Xylanibacillus composti]